MHYLLLLFLVSLGSRQNCIDSSATNNTLPLECRLAILHGYSLRILQFIFLLAFDTIVKVSHNNLLTFTRELLCSRLLDELHASDTLRILAYANAASPAPRK